MKNAQVVLELIDRLTGPLKGAAAAMRNFGQNAGRVGGTAMGRGASSLASVAGRVESMEASAKRLPAVFASGRTLLAAAPIAGLAAHYASAAKSAIDFEDAFANVKKVVEASTPEYASLKQQILDLTKELPLTAVELAKMAAAGGQAGIDRGELADFVRDTAKVSTAFDMTAEEAGEAMAKLRNIFRLGREGINGLSDAINVLGNETNAKERDIIEVLTRAGAAGKDLGLTAEATSAFAAALLSAGTQSHVVATGLSAMMTKLSVFDKDSNMAATLADMGLNVEKFRKTMEFSPELGLIQVLEHINKLEGSKKKESLLDMFGMEYQDDVGRLANALPDVITNLGRVANKTTLLRDAWSKLGNEKLSTSAEQLFMSLAQAGKDPKTNRFLKALGMNSKEFAEAWKRDPGKAYGTFLDSLDKAKNKEELLKRIPERYRDGVRQLLREKDKIKDSYAQGLDAATTKVSGSMDREFKKRIETTKAHIDLFKNTLERMSINLGDKLLPHINTALSNIERVMTAMNVGTDKETFVDHLQAAMSGFAKGAGYKDFGAAMEDIAAKVNKALTGGGGAGDAGDRVGQTFATWQQNAQQLLSTIELLSDTWDRLFGSGKGTMKPDAAVKGLEEKRDSYRNQAREEREGGADLGAAASDAAAALIQAQINRIKRNAEATEERRLLQQSKPDGGKPEADTGSPEAKKGAVDNARSALEGYKQELADVQAQLGRIASGTMPDPLGVVASGLQTRKAEIERAIAEIEVALQKVGATTVTPKVDVSSIEAADAAAKRLLATLGQIGPAATAAAGKVASAAASAGSAAPASAARMAQYRLDRGRQTSMTTSVG